MLGRDRERWGGRRNVGRRRTDGQEFDGEGCGEEEPGVFSFVHGREGGSTGGNSWSGGMCLFSMGLRGGRSWSLGSMVVVAGVLSMGSLDMFPVASTWIRYKGRM